MQILSSSLAVYLDMGGYAPYIWGAYVAMALVLIPLGLRVFLQLKRAEAALKKTSN
mgnify:CR=1 FL=1